MEQMRKLIEIIENLRKICIKEQTEGTTKEEVKDMYNVCQKTLMEWKDKIKKGEKGLMFELAFEELWFLKDEFCFNFNFYPDNEKINNEKTEKKINEIAKNLTLVNENKRKGRNLDLRRNIIHFIKKTLDEFLDKGKKDEDKVQYIYFLEYFWRPEGIDLLNKNIWFITAENKKKWIDIFNYYVLGVDMKQPKDIKEFIFDCGNKLKKEA